MRGQVVTGQEGFSHGTTLGFVTGDVMATS